MRIDGEGMRDQVRHAGERSYLLTSDGMIMVPVNGHYTQCVGQVGSEGEFNRWIDDEIRHQDELRELQRVECENPQSTIWGQISSSITNGEGITRVRAETSGGLILGETANQKVRGIWRRPDAHYEMECDWAVVAMTFPKFFTLKERRMADGILKDLLPHQYMCVTGRPVMEWESSTLREEMLQIRVD